MEHSMEIPQKINVQLPYDPAIPLLGNDHKKMKTLTWKDTCIPMYIVALSIVAKIWDQHNVHQMDK